MIRKKFSSKRDKDNKQCFSCLFEKKQLDKFFKSNPDALKGIYSHFRIFYNDDGTSKSITDLMRISSSSTVNFGTFYLSQVSARIVSKEKINYDIVDKLSIEEKKNIVANYDTLIYQIYRKFSILSTKLSDGSYLYDSMDNDLKKHIEYNVKYYFQLALKYSNEVSVFINRYPELVNHNISYYITNTPHINYYLKLINKNKLVQRVVEGKQIDIIQVPDGISYRNSGRSK
mgnify:CR=1 FL=1